MAKDVYEYEEYEKECNGLCEVAKAGLVVGAFAVAGALVYAGIQLAKDKKEADRLGGKLLKVNYKFSKEF